MEKTEKSETVITGHVFDERDKPVAGATVICNGVGTRTLFNGSYTFENLTPGPHVVEVNLEGYSKQNRQIDAEKGEVTIVDFHLEPEAGDAKIYGYIFDEETMEPVKEGGSMYMLRPTSNRNMHIDPNTGYYEFTHLPQGTHTIWTSILDYEEQRKMITVKEGEERREDFHIKKKEEEEVPWG